ncbi:hypothetical protein BGZ72_009576 [Mortierella alpina]|nr:hypothetical protein BGZ72_009576 [Mortierella alpina]
MSTRHARTADKTTNDKHTRILKALLQKPENRFCVDCRKKDPRWASFNLGCFMCIRCSGVHRSMGTHISKVKSVDLDSWTVEQVENMIKWGNEKANMYWEARLSESSIPNESTSGIDPWIRSKYEHKVFVKKGPFPDPSELGPIDEAMLMQLYGKTEGNTRTQAHMDRSKESSGSFGTIAPPPSNPTRSSFPKKPASSSGVQGADLFAIGQGSSSAKAPAQVDFFGLNDPVPAPSAQQAQRPSSTNQSATQDLFSMTAPSSTPSTPATTSQPSTPKTGNTDWKNSIMSLYGNQSSAPKSNNGFGQLQGMDAFGFGQAPVQPQQQQQQQQHNPWGNDDGFGAMQHASGPSTSNSAFGAFTSATSTPTNNNNNAFGNNGFGNNGFGNGSSNGFNQGNGFSQGNGSGQGSNFSQAGSGMPQGGDFFNMIAGATRTPVASPPPSNNKNNRRPSLETLPLECIQCIMQNLSDDCRALYGLLLMNKSWFQMVLPFLYRSPMALIDATWPKLLPYAQVLKKEPPLQVPAASSRPATPADEVRPGLTTMAADEAHDRQQAGMRSGRSMSSTRRTSTASSSSGYGYGYAPRTHSRSSSHSSTRSIPGDAYHQGRNDALAQKEQREKLVKRKKMQVLWLLLNCTISEEEHQAHASALAPVPPTIDNPDSSSSQCPTRDRSYSNNSGLSTSKHSSSLLALDPNPNLDIDTTFFKPAVDYLSYYTHHYHPGLRLSIWRLFPSIEDDFTIEWRLINHSPGRIRELFMETVQLQDLVPLAAKLETLQRIRTCHEAWDVPGSMEFMSLHNQLFGTVRMLEFAAYLPDHYDTAMNDDIGQLISQVDHLTVLELSGFEMLRTQLGLIPRRHLKVLRLKCGKSNPEMLPSTMTLQDTDVAADSAQNSEGKISMATFLSQCRHLEELLLRPVDENLLEWAVQERREFQAGSLLAVPSSASPSPALAHDPKPTLVPLRTIELFGTESEHIATTICHAAEAFQDTLEVIKVNGHSYNANRSFKNLSWRCMLPRLKVLKIVGRSNLPFDLQALRYCPALKTLDLSKYSGMRACSEALLLNLKYLTKLEYLGLSSFDHLTDSTLRTILGCMPRLKHLRLAIGDSAASTLASSSSLASPSGLPAGGGSGPGRGSANIRASGILSSGSGASPGTSGTDSNGPVGSGSGGGGGGVEMSFRSPFAALSLNSSSTASFSTVSPVSSSITTSPTPTLQSQQNQQQTLQQPSSHHHTPLPPPISTVPSSSSSTYHPYMSAGASFSGSAYDLASSARSTSSLMERFHLENNFLSLEGILDAIDGLSVSKNQLEKLSIVLGKLDFEEHYHRLEQYNVLHQDLEIAVYRYPHSV